MFALSGRQHDNLNNQEESDNLTRDLAIEQEPIDNIHDFKEEESWVVGEHE
jgi:hypothetical protein